jgi:dTMP kinase
MAEVVEPALAAGRTVVSDRSAYSSLAYQGYGRGLPLDELRQLSDWAVRGRWPDRVVLLDVPPSEAASRLSTRGSADRLEREEVTFHQRVRDGFKKLAAQDPTRWAVVDGTGSSGEVASRILEACTKM